MAQRRHTRSDIGFIEADDLHAAVESQREAKGLSRTKAARQIGVSPSTLTRLAQGKTPGSRNMIRIGQWMGWQVDPLGRVAEARRRPTAQPLDLLTVVRRHLQASGELSRATAAALIRVLETTYDEL